MCCGTRQVLLVDEMAHGVDWSQDAMQVVARSAGDAAGQ